MADSQKKTRVDSFIYWCKNHKIISTVIIIAIIVIAIAKFTDAVTQINSFFNKKDDSSARIDDRDVVDNKGAYMPTTNVTQNPKPLSQLDYETISLNEKVNGVFQSEFKLTFTIPQGGWVEKVTFPDSLICEKILPKNGDSLGGQGFGINGAASIEQHRFKCTSTEPIVDTGYLFKIY